MRRNFLRQMVVGILFMGGCAAGQLRAGVFYDLSQHTSSTTLKVSGDMKVAASTSSYSTPVITLQGSTGKVIATSFQGSGANLTGVITNLIGVAYSSNTVPYTGATGIVNLGAYGVNTSSAVNSGVFQISGSTVMRTLATGGIAIGPEAGGLYSGTYGTFVGNGAGNSHTNGDNSTFVGTYAGYYNTTGDHNTFIGAESGNANVSGGENVYIGAEAGKDALGWYNTGVGRGSLRYLTSGRNNATLGYRAGFYNQTGYANTIVGAEAGWGASGQSFSSSTLLGYWAGYALTTGSDNIFIGYKSGDSATSGSRNIIIGHDKDLPAATTNDYLNIGGLIVGDLSGSSATVNGSLYVGGTNITTALDGKVDLTETSSVTLSGGVLINSGELSNLDYGIRLSGGPTGNANIEIRNNGGTPYIDISNSITEDYDVRMIMTGDDVLSLQSGQLEITGNSSGIGLNSAALVSGGGFTTAGQIYSSGTASNYFAGNISMASGKGLTADGVSDAIITANDGVIGAKMFAGSGGQVIFGEGTNERMRLENTGRLSVPGYIDTQNLYVSGEPLVTRTGGRGEFNMGSGADMSSLALFTDGQQRLNIISGGNVGIGQTSPQAKLHVSSGTILSDGLNSKIQTTSGAGSTKNGYALLVSSSTGEHIWGIHNDGHMSIGGYAATLGTCTNGTIVTNSHDLAGAVSFNGSNSSCAINFGAALDSMPFCILTLVTNSPGPTPTISTESASGFTIVPSTGSFASGDRINWFCPEAHE